MKNKSGILIILLFMLGFSSQAQLKRFSLGPYVEAGFPDGDLSDTHKTGYGVGLGVDVKLIAGFGATGSLGYMRFAGQKEVATGIKYPALQAIPVRIGLKYQFIPLLYVKVESGAANFIGETDGSAVIVAPGIGLRFMGLDVQAKYEAWFRDGTRGFWGLKAGYNF